MNLPCENLASLVEKSARLFPEKTALIDGATQISYQVLWEKITDLAGLFIKQGMQPELLEKPVVGLLFYNDVNFIASYFALLGLGITVIPLSTRLTAEEIATILEDARASWLVTSEEFRPDVSLVQTPFLKAVLFVETLSGEAVVISDLKPLSEKVENELEPEISIREVSKTSTVTFPAAIRETDLATLIYTSGTTGKPKGVMLSHGNILADARANAQVIEAVKDDRFITISPLFHVFGQTNVLITAILAGASIVLVKKFNPAIILENIETHRVTFMAAVPTMYQMMLSQMQERSYDLSSLRVCHSGASPMAREVFRQVEAAFGAPVQEGYGLSEASSIITSNPMHGERKPGSVGLPLPGITIQVMDEDMCESVPGEIGEIHVQGPTVMQGYYERPDETKKAIVNGWLKTKDMAYRDEDGYIYIVDRKDDLINIGGAKVYPREIEEVLYRHPMIDSVAVTGISSELYNEEIKAFVVLKPGEKTSSKMLQKFCAEHLAKYKIPKYFEFLPEIPKGATGKILRKELRKKI